MRLPRSRRTIHLCHHCHTPIQAGEEYWAVDIGDERQWTAHDYDCLKNRRPAHDIDIDATRTIHRKGLWDKPITDIPLPGTDNPK